MKKWTINEIVGLVDGKLVQGNGNTVIDDIVVDSRKAVPGCLFIPLRGEQVDGHQFIADAAGRGAQATFAGFAWLESNSIAEIEIIGVADTSVALQMWARNHIHSLKAKIVGVTGSTGKTTTKEMIAAILQSRWRILKNEGNLNTEIGLPLTVLQAGHEHEILVLEMGMRGLGEITQLTDIAPPDIAVLTNVGEAHIELLGSVDNIAQAKGEILDALPEHGVAVLNGDDRYVLAQAQRAPRRRIYFGIDAKPEQTERVYATDIKSKGAGLEFVVNWRDEKQLVSFPWPGRHNVYNAVAAIAVGLACGMKLVECIRGLASYVPAANRLNIYHSHGYVLIDDTYNASPISMQTALQVLAEYPGVKRRRAILGDMLELGQLSHTAHWQLGQSIRAYSVDELITVGPSAAVIAQGAADVGLGQGQIHSFMDNRAAITYLRQTTASGDLLLVKGSRSMRMEEIVQALLEGEN